MGLWRFLVCFAVLPCLALGQQPSAASLLASLHQLTIDPSQIYHARDLRFSRGDFTIYLNDGLLAFAKPVGSNVVCAVFTTEGLDTGDAEILVSPPTRGERASLAYFAKTPNLDEHFSQAVFIFTDQTRAEALHQMEQSEISKAPINPDAFGARWNPAMSAIAAGVEVPVLESILNQDPPSLSLFYAVIGGNNLGPFEICFNPHQTESSLVGRAASSPGGANEFQIWTSFTPRKSHPVPPPAFRTGAYQIDATITPDLHVSAVTSFRAVAARSHDRAIEMELADRMRVTAASIDGKPVEVVQPDEPGQVDDANAARLLLVNPEPIPQGTTVEVAIHHEGPVIKDVGEGVYFVEARNIWFPHLALNPATFDLTFHCPAKLKIVSSGRLISEAVDGDTRIVHRALDTPVQFVGFNLGDFVGIERNQPPFHIEFYADRAILTRIIAAGISTGGGPSGFPEEMAGMADRTAVLLKTYAAKWGPVPAANIAVTPIPGTFGQGFPGLIYLSVNSYLPPAFRPAFIRDNLLNAFYSDILLAHEIAHQWWGNMAVAEDYRSGWLTEALANYAALEFYEGEKGLTARDELLQYYAKELEAPGKGAETLEDEGPLNVGLRLRSIDANAWRVITYDKGTWVIRMLAERLGPERFAQFERTLLQRCSGRGLSNEVVRETAAEYLPNDDPDPTLEYFFDSWVYGVGVPRLTVKRTADRQFVLRQTGVGKDFSADVPLRISAPGASDSLLWVRSSSEGTAFAVPSAKVTVSLPAPSDFLYLAGETNIR